MRYISTRGQSEPLPFQSTVLTGLARDGGLFLPQTIPNLSDRLAHWRHLSWQDLAFEIASLFADDIPPAELRQLIQKSYSTFRHPEVTPLVKAGPVHLLELFHGPTLAFKDVALQFLGNLFEYILKKSGGEMNIVAATSGDTGSAAIYGVRGRERIRIFVMFPHGRVSPMQELQMTTVLDHNVHNLTVQGTFDDCQDIVKALFNDLPFRDKHHLGAVNSINWARILAQIVYYFYATFRVQATTGAESVRFSVPTGNFGDIFAGYLARKMGLPIDKLVLASNENDILARYFTNGTYARGTVSPTLSPSMDIQVASNFERYLYYLAGEDATRLTAWMHTFQSTGALTPNAPPQSCFSALRGDTAATLATIRRWWQEYGYLLDPHTAVGVWAGQHYLNQGSPMICLATAHPAKFPAAIRQATESNIAHHPILDQLVGKPVRVQTVPASAAAVAQVVTTTTQGA